ncbi:hypothetical protein HD553DRAFT_307146 [Filobasidium floriforme]|uniref:uncharacterized protein n=1 Tax=Filobasidium floriforme TaxID=5210 RepID=UPI001E8CF4B8|nr:uncharacterized protein HD553DRAFT_307146 [Filobasidium floriforme]KAH8088032.1 hypothetical protein HD553DRAFT_307146 [Filobasidium floriforme]
MLMSTTKNALSRGATFVFVGGRTFSSTRPTLMEKSMADLLQEIPPELAIPVSTPYSGIGRRFGKARTERKETVSFGSKPNQVRAEQNAQRLYKREDSVAGGFGSMMRKDKAVAASSSTGGSRSQGDERAGQRERKPYRNDKPARPSESSGSSGSRSAQSGYQPREKFSRIKPMAAEPPVQQQQIRLEDYAPQKPRGQDDLFGTTSLLDVDVASMNQVEGQNAEFVGDEQNISADRDSALHRALLSVGSYSHLVPAPFSQSTISSTNSILDPKTNRETLHRFAVHQADFALTRGVNVSEGQRGIAKGVIMGRLGVKA